MCWFLYISILSYDYYHSFTLRLIMSHNNHFLWFTLSTLSLLYTVVDYYHYACALDPGNYSSSKVDVCALCSTCNHCKLSLCLPWKSPMCESQHGLQRCPLGGLAQRGCKRVFKGLWWGTLDKGEHGDSRAKQTSWAPKMRPKFGKHVVFLYSNPLYPDFNSPFQLWVQKTIWPRNKEDNEQKVTQEGRWGNV